MPQDGKRCQQQEEEQTANDADQGADSAVDCVIFGVLHIRLHADDRRDRGLCWHVLPLISAQRINQKAQKHRERGFGDALPDMGQMKGLGGVEAPMELSEKTEVQANSPF